MTTASRLAGGIATAGNLTLTDTVVSGNTTTLAAGGILAIDLGDTAPVVTLLRSSVRNNSAVGLTGTIIPGVDLGGGVVEVRRQSHTPFAHRVRDLRGLAAMRQEQNKRRRRHAFDPLRIRDGLRAKAFKLGGQFI